METFISIPVIPGIALLMVGLSVLSMVGGDRQAGKAINLLLILQPIKLQEALLFSALLLLSGCTTLYLDGSTREINAYKFEKPDITHPVQVILQFQSRGVANPFVTNKLKEKVIAQIKASGLFSDVSDMPLSGGALLTITLNNFPITEVNVVTGTHAFVSGLTFGLIGQRVSAGYACTARYFHDRSSQPIETASSHSIHQTHGFAPAPKQAVRTRNANDAISLMTRQVVSNILYKLSRNTAFK